MVDFMASSQMARVCVCVCVRPASASAPLRAAAVLRVFGGLGATVRGSVPALPWGRTALAGRPVCLDCLAVGFVLFGILLSLDGGCGAQRDCWSAL